jgi:uncharacterized protein
LLGEQHDRLWDIVKAELKKIMPPKGLAQPKKKSMVHFAAVMEQYLFFEDQSVVEGLAEAVSTCTKTLFPCSR